MSAETYVLGAALSALKKPLGELYELAKREGKQFFVSKENASHLKLLKSELKKVEIVKTLWKMDKGVSLYDFYFPQTIQWDTKSKVRIGNIDELPPNQNYLVEGRVGQGKSIFLRYLCCQELRKPENARIPLFVELRFVDSKHGLQDLIFDGFRRLGFKISEDLLHAYAKSGKFVLLLDAFDEIDEKEASSVAKELEALSETYPSLQIVVTSRPDSSLSGLRLFQTLKLQPLIPDDLEPLLGKIVKDITLAKNIRKAIRKSDTGVQSLLTTPLLVTLLAIVYQSSQTIPSNISDLCNKLFEVVFLRHDQTKTGFKRRLATDLGEIQARKLFEAFCFCCYARGTTGLKPAAFSDCARIASQHTGIAVNVDHFCHDMVSVAGLLHQEGSAYHFVHRSVVEFFAASFVASSSEAFAKDFYTKLALSFSDWRQVAAFLQQIDKYKFAINLGIPAIERWAKSKGVQSEIIDGAKATRETAKRILGDWSLILSFQKNPDKCRMAAIMFVHPMHKVESPFANGLIEDLLYDQFSKKFGELVRTEQSAICLGLVSGRLHLVNMRNQVTAFDPAIDNTTLDSRIQVCALLEELVDDTAIDGWLSDGLAEMRATYRDFKAAVTLESKKIGMLDLLTKREIT